MFDFEKPNIRVVEISEDERFGRFVCEPLERGYGTTLGNSLKRIRKEGCRGVWWLVLSLRKTALSLTLRCYGQWI